MRPAPCALILCLTSLFLVGTLTACGDDGNPLVPLPTNPSEDASLDISDETLDVVPDIFVPDEPLDIPGCDPTAVDDPDPLGEDTNCDGVDGDAMRSIFVASYGADDNPGSRQRPKLTINGAIAAAVLDDARDWVIVENGLYQEDVTLVNGVSLAGGYRFGWERNPRSHVVIRGTNPAITGKDITDPTTLMNLEVQVSANAGPGQTSITMLLENSSGVTLDNVIITGGRGGEGQAGQEWTGTLGDGASGNVGNRGGNGESSSSCLTGSGNAPSGGAARPSSCNADAADEARAIGGKGGNASSNDNSPSGLNGSAGGDGAAGGRGGQGESTPGLIGSDGGAGTPGVSGLGGGVAGQFMDKTWQGAEGTVGGMGFPGSGGGGGGAGGYNERTFACDAYGGAGGSGGSGGCGGKGGNAGKSGGASVALFLVDSDVVLLNCYIDMGQGGAGGAGSKGGPGGDGGNGGNGGAGKNDSGKGAAGGSGGKGGEGGSGGAGAGGPVFGIYSNVSLTNDSTLMNDFAGGSGGAGGNGAGGNQSNGAMGQVVAIQVGPIEDPNAE